MSKAKLVDSGTCQTCAKCCKEFTTVQTRDAALRYKWLMGNKIKVIGTPFKNKRGELLFQITFLTPCKKLGRHKRTGKYYCKVWNKERPDCCRTYPDHVFVDAYEQNKDIDFLKGVKQFESKNCPALNDYYIEQILARLDLQKL